MDFSDLSALFTGDSGTLLVLALSLLATGAVAGLLAGLLGVGGGIVIVPVLYHVFGLMGIDDAVRIKLAVGTSLATILITGFSSARTHLKKGSVDTQLLRSWGPAIAIGVVAGAVLSGYLESQVLVGIFAAVAMIVAINMAFRSENMALADQLPGRPFREILGLIIGGFSVLMGIGGGTLSVPILTLFRYPIKRAVGTASAIGLIIAVPGVLGAIWFGLDVGGRPEYSLGYVNLIGFALIIPTSAYFAPWGARIAHAIPARMLRWAFAIFLFITSVRMIQDLLPSNMF
ncbi:MAG: sulfite exporter TauE/SafE family protein [Cohaesibacteraceae bacterium]|nr:sulfite exporter TauE/SafE family protein [Cohaesibacteraceae bacterium]